MKILYIVNTAFPLRPYHDGSVRYRCFNPGAELARRGHRTLVITQTAFERAPKSDFDIYVFHRPHCTPRLSELLLKLKKNSLLIADYDDFSFHVSAVAHLPGVLKNRFLSSDLRHHMSIQGEIAPMFDCFTLSSIPLQDKVKELFQAKNTLLIHNAIPSNVRALCAMSRARNPWASRRFFFGYFSGSKSHSRDLGMIMDMVLAELNKHNAKMLLAGYGDISCGVYTASNACITIQYLVPFMSLPEYMSQCRFILAPLENTPFTQCKSGIKFFEAALCGCPVLATPIPDINRFTSDLLLRCDTPDQWQETLTNLSELDFDFENSIAKLEKEIALETQMDKFEKAFIF